MKCVPIIQLLLLLTVSFGITSGAFWDDLADAVEDIVDENLGENNGLDLDDAGDLLDSILDEAKEFLDEPGGVLPGGNIGGDDNSIFKESFTPVETGSSEESDDLTDLLDELGRIAGQIGKLVTGGGDTLSDDELQEALDSILDQDEVLELFLTALLEYVVEDLGLEVNEDLVTDRLVPLIVDVYNVVKVHSENATSVQGLAEQELILDILDSVMKNLFPDMTVSDVFCRAAANGVERALGESFNSVTEVQQSITRNLALLVIGCEEELLNQQIFTQARRLSETFGRLINGSLGQQNFDFSNNMTLNNLINSNLSSVLTSILENFPALQTRIQNISASILPRISNSINGTQGDRNQDILKTLFQGFGSERNLLDLFRERIGSGDTQTTPTVITEKSTTPESSRPTSSPTKKSATTIQFTTPTSRPTATTTKMAPTTTTLPTSTTTATTVTATTTASSTRPTVRLFPFLPRRDGVGELRTELRQAVTNATERLVRLIREEIQDSRLAQLLYTLLNSDLVRQVLQALDVPLPPLQTTTVLTPTSETPEIDQTTADLFSNSDAIIQRIPSAAEPEVQAMAQTAIQVLQTANLSDPESIVTTAGQVLLGNVRATIQAEVLSDPLQFVGDIVNFITRNNSLLARVIPQETMTAINEGLGPALQATQFATSLAQLYSTSGDYNTSQRCTAERAAVGEGITLTQSWALAFLDSMGKLGTGFLQGNTWLEGNYDQCQAIQASTDTGDVINGQYVKMRFRLQIPGLPVSGSSELSSQETGLPNILWHVCLPKGCNSDDVTKIGDTIAESADASIESVEATILEKRDPSSEPAFIIAVAVLSTLGLLCLIGTAVDVALTNEKPDNINIPPGPAAPQTVSRPEARSKRRKNSRLPVHDEELPSPTGEKMMRRVTFQESREGQGYEQPDAVATPSTTAVTPQKKSGMAKFFLAFSVYTNSRDVVKAAHAPGDLSCLHGIRVISILWVILGHVYYFAPQFGNAITFVEISKWWTFHAILNALFAVDTFFTISGCLVSYLFLRTVKKAGGLKVAHMAMYYVHRYLRLTPLYALAILVYHGLTPYLEDGPFLVDNSDRGENCKDLWWTNLLYFSNLRRDVRQCMGWSWYLPNDMQFYAAAPLVLVPLALGYKYLGLLVAFLQVALHLIMYAVMVEKYDANLFRDTFDFFINIYIKPYTRCGPYAIGLALGYLLFKTKGKFKMPKILVALGWLLAVGGGLTLVYISHDNLKEFGLLKPTWSDNQMNALDIVSKPLWSLCVAWVVLACVNGYGGVVNSFLSWTVWVPLSRLTFGTYLVHPMVLYYFNYNRRNVLYFTYHFVIERFLATVLLSFVISYILSLLIETPVRNLIKPARKPEKSTREPEVRGLSSRLRQDQDKKSNSIALTNIAKLSQSKAEGLRNRNIYLPRKPTALAHEQTPSSPEPAFPVTAGSGLYPTILSETQEDTYSSTEPKVTRRSTNRKVVYETLSKTASFDDEEPESDFPNLLSQPASPEPIQERPTLTREEILDPDFDTNVTSPNAHRHKGGIKEEFENGSDPIPSQNEDTAADVENPKQSSLPIPAAAQFPTEASLENVPTDFFPPAEDGVVNEAYAHDNDDDLDIVLPSAPPETPESGRSLTSRKAVATLA